MTKLSEKDQCLLLSAITAASHMSYTRVLKRSVVEDYLIQKDDEHKADIAELKAKLKELNEIYLVCKCRPSELAQHDKQVVIKTLNDFGDYMAECGHSLVNPVWLSLDEYINQLEEK